MKMITNQRIIPVYQLDVRQHPLPAKRALLQHYSYRKLKSKALSSHMSITTKASSANEPSESEDSADDGEPTSLEDNSNKYFLSQYKTASKTGNKDTRFVRAESSPH